MSVRVKSKLAIAGMLLSIYLLHSAAHVTAMSSGKPKADSGPKETESSPVDQENVQAAYNQMVNLKNQATALKIKLDAALRQVELEKEKIKELTEENKQLKYKVRQVTETYIVKKDESLWTIAGKKEVYGDPYKWLILYHSNRDQIYDPDFIYPNMVLLIPRQPGLERKD